MKSNKKNLTMRNNIGADLVQLLQEWGATEDSALILRMIIVFSLIIISSLLANWITKNVIIVVVKSIIKRSKNEYDDLFVKKKVFEPLSHIVPALIIYFTLPLALETESIISILQSFTYIYMIIAVMVVINRGLNALNEIYELIAEKKQINMSIKGYIQVIKIIFIIIAIILIVAVLLDKKPGAIFAGLGALTAVILLVFKDSILGFVASIQLSAYKMLKVGDWISMPSRNADGDVIDISLSTVKVQNFNKTISTIPTYAMVQESFTNWNGMQKAGARRIMRDIFIDINSIKFVDDALKQRFKKIHYLEKYIDEKSNEIEEWNKNNNIDSSVVVNGRRMTNIGTFRKYIEFYLRDNFKVYKKLKKQKFTIDNVVYEDYVIKNKDEFIELNGFSVEKYISDRNGIPILINIDKFLEEFQDNYVMENDIIFRVKKTKKRSIKKGSEIFTEDYTKVVEKEGKFDEDMTILVRQLEATEKGVPLQIYVFAATTVWVEYEAIQSDLFDHLLAIIPEFDLRIFQRPGGEDIKEIKKI